LTVLPSLFEGTPNAALESMASGVPVIATDVSDNSYVIPTGKVGYVVPSGDEVTMANRIMELLRDSNLRASFGKAAREWVLSEFSGRRLAEKTAAVYDEAINLRGAL
jgi:glycosyltransferase involved in cell wall biosynthesis